MHWLRHNQSLLGGLAAVDLPSLALGLETPETTAQNSAWLFVRKLPQSLAPAFLVLDSCLGPGPLSGIQAVGGLLAFNSRTTSVCLDSLLAPYLDRMPAGKPTGIGLRTVASSCVCRPLPFAFATVLRR